MDGYAGDHQQVAVQREQAGSDGIVLLYQHAACHRQRPVHPCGADHAAVALGVQLSVLLAHVDLGVFLDAEAGGIRVGSGHVEAVVYLDTHYYGGVKKYQWVALPMAMHGVIVKKDGTVVNVTVGEDEDDPVLYITDLLIHLAGQQMAKKASEVVEGEKLDILIGSQPLKDLPDDKKKEAVKENVLRILNEKYGVEEEDFLSAELEIVPAGKARDCGLDRSMIAGYGQDDRVCAYTSLLALLEMEAPKRTSC